MANVRRHERGAAALEFAILLPLLLLILFEVISWAYMFSFRQALSQAASEGARAAVGGSTTLACAGAPSTFSTTLCPAQYAAARAVENALGQYGMTCVGGTPANTHQVQCSIPGPTTCTGDATHTCIRVTVSYPYRSEPLLSGMPSAVPPFSLVLPPDLSFTSVVEVG
jgi:Flp pilus assembly protein TadG